MRRTIATLTGLLLLATAATASANAGLPELATLHLGTNQAVLYADSPTLHTGTNTFTLAIPSLPAGSHVLLTALGPDGQAVDVDLQPLTVLADEDMSGMAGMAGMSQDSTGSSHDMAGMSHDMAGMSHDSTAAGHDHAAATPAPAAADTGHDHAAATPASDAAPESAHSHDAHSDLPTTGYVARGAVRLGQTGSWTLLVEGAGSSDKTVLEVVPGGPSRLYLGATGSLIGGFLIYGAVERRRKRAGGK